MYVTTNYLGIRQGAIRYLFYLLSQDYIEDNKAVQDGVAPLLQWFARELAGDGAVVAPFEGMASENLSRVVNSFERPFIESLHSLTPALLVLDRDLSAFSPGETPYLLISLRDSMDEFGRPKVFELQRLFEMLVEASREPGLLDRAERYLREARAERTRDALWQSLQLQPSFFGLGMDVRAAIDAFRKRSA
jgi:hypothetical protein